MDYTTRPTILWIFLCVFLFASCDKLCDCDDDPKPCLFSYGKVSFTPTPGQEQIVNPTFTQGESDGTFSASPSGLDIDEESGAININNSEPDQEYTITYTLGDEKTTCSTSIYIGETEVKECALKYDTTMVTPGDIDFLLARIDEKAVTNGKFYAIPAGLSINPSNGSIDVNASEAGIKYTIFYESGDGKIVCEAELMISGIDYIDTRVTFVEGEESFVNPIFDANPQQPAPEGFYSSPDETLTIDPFTGEIALKQTLLNVDFADNGEADISIINFRETGFTRTYTINYTIGQSEDPSQLEVQIFWFANEEDIPEDLLEVFEGKQAFPENGKMEGKPPYILTSGSYNR